MADHVPAMDVRTSADRLNIAIKTMRYVIENGLPFDPMQYSMEGNPRKRCGDLSSWIGSDPGVLASGFHMELRDGVICPSYHLPGGGFYLHDDAFAAWMGIGMVCAKWLLYPSFYALDGIPDPNNEMTASMVQRRLEWLMDHPRSVNLGWDYFFEKLDVGVA